MSYRPEWFKENASVVIMAQILHEYVYGQVEDFDADEKMADMARHLNWVIDNWQPTFPSSGENSEYDATVKKLIQLSLVDYNKMMDARTK